MSTHSLKNKVVLVTGATDGIGKETVRKLAARGAKVLLHGRDRARAVRAASDVRRTTRSKDIDILIADFTSLAQVRQLVSEIRKTYPDLQILINNAGVFNGQRRLTEDGFEETFQVQYLAPFLLTTLLRDTLESIRPSRVVNVTSILHKGAELDFSNLQGEKSYNGLAAYATSKLALTLFTFELAARISGPGLTANCVHPGVVNTKLLRASWGAMPGLAPPEGAEFPYFAATAESLEDVTGKYFEKTREAAPDPRAYDRGLRKKMWDYSRGLLQMKRTRAA